MKQNRRAKEKGRKVGKNVLRKERKWAARKK